MANILNVAVIILLIGIKKTTFSDFISTIVGRIVTPKRYEQFLTPRPVMVTLFGTRVFVDEI